MAGPANRVQPFSTGISLVYVSFGGPVTPQKIRFFGTCEGYPKHERRPDWMQVPNDVSGRRKPMDMSFQGEDATISLDMTVWDEGVAQMIDQFPDMSGSSGLATPGSWRFLDMGALMGFEQLAMSIWIVWTYGSTQIGGPKIAYTAGGLPAGYHYLQCIPMGPQGTEEGAQGLIRNFNFYAWPVTNWQNYTQTLYDNSMAAIAGVTINGPLAA